MDLKQVATILLLFTFSHKCDSNNEYLQPMSPTVVVVVLVRNKAHTLPYFFSCLEALDYPKDRMFIWIYSDYNQDNSSTLIEKWSQLFSHQYGGVNITVESDSGPLLPGENKPNEWTSNHFRHIIKLREQGLEFARSRWPDYMFMLDSDVFLTNSASLEILVKKNQPIVSPLLISDGLYSNFWGGMTDEYYYSRTELYETILDGNEIGCFDVPMVHSAVLVNLNMVGSKLLTYDPSKLANYDGPEDDIIVFALSATQNKIPLHICNDYYYGYVPVPLEADDDPVYDYDQVLNVKLEAISKGDPIKLNEHFKEDVNYPEMWKYNCDDIYFINLERRVERRSLMEQSFRELGMDVNYFKAVDGQNIDDNFIKKNGIKLMKNYEDPYHKRPMKAGEIGCFLSHYKIWEEIVELGLKKTLILEDDVRFVPYFRYKFTNLTKDISLLNWDLVYIGRKILLDKDEVHVTKHLVKPIYSYWTLGYLLSLEGAKKLLNAKPLETMLPVDEFLPIMFDQHTNDTWKSYFPNRNLVAFSASPLLVHPTHYVGEDGHISDTESSDIINNNDLIKTEL